MAFDKREEDKILLWMYPNKKEHDKQPDITGPGRINKEVLKELVESYKKYGDNGSLKLRAAGWDRTGKKGDYTFITIEVERPKPPEEDPSDEIPF
jgi:hypothetical protein